MQKKEAISQLIIESANMIEKWSNDASSETDSLHRCVPSHEHYSADGKEACRALKKLDYLTGRRFHKSYLLAKSIPKNDACGVIYLEDSFKHQSNSYLNIAENNTSSEFSKSDLIATASDVLEENAGWWNPTDAQDDEEAKEYQQNLDDIHKTEDLLDQGELKDPYGSISDAYDDYYDYVSNSEDDDFENGADGKQRELDELDALNDALE